MYVLLPDDPHIDFIKLAVIFVSATLLGFASHSPGGLGVFDAAMLVALIEFDKEELLAGLLLFRLLYYIIPFALSLLILGRARAWLAVARACGGRSQASDESGDALRRLPADRDGDPAPRSCCAACVRRLPLRASAAATRSPACIRATAAQRATDRAGDRASHARRRAVLEP